MSDFTLVDSRGSAAGAALREAALRRPISARSDRAASVGVGGRPGSSSRLRPALIAAFVVLLIAALVALANRDPQPAQPSGPQDLRYIVAGLDRTWTVFGARDGDGIDADPLPGYRGTLYGTLGDPTKPAMLVTWVDTSSNNASPFNGDGFTSLIGGADLEQFEVQGQTAGCAIRPTGETECSVETENGFVASLSQGVSRDALKAMLTTLRFDGTTATIDPQSLPTGLDQVASGPLGTVVRSSDVFSGAASAVRWTNSDGSAVNVTVVHDDGVRLTRYAVEPGWKPVRIGQVSGFRLNAAANVSTLMWSRDGKVFTVEASLGANQPGSAADLAERFATALRPATDAQWRSLPAWTSDEVSPDTTALESPFGTDESTTTAPPSSVPGSGKPADIDVGLDTIGQFGGEITVRNTGPRVADDQFTVGFAIDSFRIRGEAGSGNFRLTDETVLQIVPSTAATGVYVVTRAEGELVVTGQDGTRYHATAEAIFDGVDVRFAMINLKVNFVKAEFIAPDGSVLAEIPGNV